MTGNTLSRRRILALAATTVVAGCGEQDDSETGTNNRFAGTVGNTESTSTATATAEGTDDGGSVELDIETPTETERPTEEPAEPEPDDRTPEERTPTGTEHVGEARAALNRSVAAYVPVEDVTSVLKVDASTTDFDPKAVREELSAAATHLESAADASDVEEATVTELRTAREAIAALVRCQVAVIDAYSQFDRAMRALFDEEFDTVREALSTLDLRREQAATQRRSFEEATAASDFDPVDGVTERDYAEKVAQFATEIDGLERFKSPIEEFHDGLERFATGVDSYVGLDYRGAEPELLASLNGFELTSTTLSGMSPPAIMEKRIGRLQGAAAALANGTDRLIESCRAGKNGDEQQRESRFNNALQAYSRSGKVRNLPSYEQLNDET